MNMGMTFNPSVEASPGKPYVPARASRKDKPVSMLIAALLHVAIVAIAGATLVKPPEFGVDQGVVSLEVNLVAAPSEVVPQPQPQLQPTPLVEETVVLKPDMVPQEIVVPKPVIVQKTLKPLKPVVQPRKIEQPKPVVERQVESHLKGKDDTTLQSTGGARSEAKPDYLNNPPPAYPESARRRGHAGTVWLMVRVDKEGLPARVSVEKSSGHSLLDEVAAKAVRKWKFRPGKIGTMPIESTVRVPITFDLRK